MKVPHFLPPCLPASLLLVLIFTISASEGRAAQGPGLPPCPHRPIGAVHWAAYFGETPSHHDIQTGVATIDAGRIVYLNGDQGFEISLLIVYGSLVFDHCIADMELKAASILVIDEGVLQIGKSDLEFPHLATIRLRDWPSTVPYAEIAAASAQDIHIENALLDRGLVVANGGTLRLYGKDRGEVWTRLGATAHVDDLTITMADPVLDLENGDEIIIASTDFDQNQAEYRQIASATGNQASFLDLLVFQHYGVVQNFEPVGYSGTGEWDVDERAEVGLLNRNIKVIGMEGDSEDDHGHVFFYRTSGMIPEASPPEIQISWAEFKDLGIGGVTGRYPVHFHMIGDLATTPTLFIKNSSVRNSYNRGIVVHETSDVRIEDNVVHDTMGHGIYLEDYTVKDCDVLNNLSLVNRIPTDPPTGALVDGEPGNITLRSLDNDVQGNVAAGSAAYGIYFDLYNFPFTPAGMTFADNSAHSCQKIGIYENHELEPSTPLTFTNSRVWKCREYGMWIRSVRDYTVNGLIAADCRSGFYPASKGLREAGEGHQILTNGLFVGETANRGLPNTLLDWENNTGRSLPQHEPKLYDGEPNEHELEWDTLNGVEMYDGFIEITNCRFAEFEDLNLGSGVGIRLAAGISQVAKVSSWINDPRNRVSGLEFHDTSVVRTAHFRDTDTGNNQIAFTTIVDEDDSLGYGSNMVLMPNTPFLTSFQSSAVFHADTVGTPELNGYSVPLSSADYGQLAVRLNGIDPDDEPLLAGTRWWRVQNPSAGTPILGNQWSARTVPTQDFAGGDDRYVFPVVVEVGDAGLPAADVFYYRMAYKTQYGVSNFPANLWVWYRFAPDVDKVVFLEIPYDQSGGPSDVNYWDAGNSVQNATSVSSLTTLLAPSTDPQAWSWDSATSRLYLKLTSIVKTGQAASLYGTQLKLEIIQ